jgi:hypothetical protein
MKSTHLSSPRSCPLSVASSRWLFLAALVTHVPSSRIRPGKGSPKAQSNLIGPHGTRPVRELGSQVLFVYTDHGTRHEVVDTTFRSLLDRQDEVGAVKAMAAVAILAAVLAGCAPADATQPAAPSGKPETANAQNMPPTAPAGISAAMERVKASAKKRSILPNKVWYEANNNAVMAIIPPSPDADVQGFKADVAAISAAADGFTVGIRNALRSLEEAKAIQRRVDADTTLLRSKGINITGTGITTKGDTVLVDVVGAKDIAAVKRQLIDRYGPGIDAQAALGSPSY